MLVPVSFSVVTRVLRRVLDFCVTTLSELEAVVGCATEVLTMCLRSRSICPRERTVASSFVKSLASGVANFSQLCALSRALPPEHSLHTVALSLGWMIRREGHVASRHSVG